MRLVQGAVATGAWLSFYEFEHLDDGVLVRVFHELKKIISNIHNKQE